MKNKLSNFLIVFIAFIAGGLTMYYFSNNTIYRTIDSEGNNVCRTCNGTVIVENGSLSEAVNKVYDAVVLVNTYKNDKVSNTGSGFMYKKDDKYGYVITNHHVISGGDKFELVLSDDTKIDAKVLGSDEYLDLAVLQIDQKYVKELVSIGKSSESKLGDIVFTVGSPLGYDYRGTVTNGIISGLNRLVQVSVKSDTEDWVMEVIQTNAAVNPGNSGGPLVNAKGEVIGVISLKLVENSVEGMGFAIPIEYAIKHIDILESGKKIDRPLLGISMMNASEKFNVKLYYDISIPDEIENGVVVIEVTKDSGASKSDLTKGDVITKLNNDDVRNSAYLKYLLYKYNPGDTVKITYNRNNKILTTNITLTRNEK